MVSYLANTYAQLPVTVDRGEGSLLYDPQGKAYIDLTSGIGVCALGYADPQWLAAVTEQLRKVSHVCNLYECDPRQRLAGCLCDATGMKKVFFSNSGAEANECAIKAARKYAAAAKGEEYHYILTLKGSFHGRTLATLSATGQDIFHSQFQPLPPGFCHAAADSILDVERCIRDYPLAGILLECIQGESGVRVLERSFVRHVAQLAGQEGIPLMIDEVQTGNGRTGKLYSYMHYGITPDILSTAKGLGGGLPIGATLLGEKLQDVFCPGDHGSTFGGNPVSCAGALCVLDRLDKTMLEQVLTKGEYIRSVLTGAPGIRSVSGMGLMLGVETEKDAKAVQRECLQNGVLVLTAKERLRLLPPLNIPLPLLQTAIDVLRSACAVKAPF